MPADQRGGSSRGWESPADRSRETSLIPNYIRINSTTECYRTNFRGNPCDLSWGVPARSRRSQRLFQVGTHRNLREPVRTRAKTWEPGEPVGTRGTRGEPENPWEPVGTRGNPGNRGEPGEIRGIPREHAGSHRASRGISRNATESHRKSCGMLWDTAVISRGLPREPAGAQGTSDIVV